MSEKTAVKKKSFWATLSRAFRKVAEPWHDGSHPLELRRAILLDIEQDILEVDEGKRVYPYSHLEIRLLAETPETRAILEASLEAGLDLEDAVRRHLEDRDCRTGDLSVHVTITGEKTDDFGERRFVIEKLRGEHLTSPPRRPVIELTVIKGTAADRVYTFDQDRILFGRLREVTDENGRPRRHNDVAFCDDDEESRSVSREHGRIERRGQEIRLIDERSAGGTRIFRNGRVIRVSSRDRRGLRLRPGDLIYLGQAALRFELRDPPIKDV